MAYAYGGLKLISIYYSCIVIAHMFEQFFHIHLLGPVKGGNIYVKNNVWVTVNN